MNKTIYIIVILAIVITTISQTVSFIIGDHQFYESVQDKCVKCHGDIQSQLSTSDQHSNFTCTACHTRSATNHTNNNPECTYCHSTHLNDTLDAHPEFVSLGSEGCVACHSTYNVILNYSRSEYIDYTIKNNSGNWIVSDFKTTGTLDLSYNAMRQGGKHDLKNVLCKDCHKDIFDAVSLGGHAVVLARNGTQTAYHNNSNSTNEEWCRTCHNRNDTKYQPPQHSARKTTCDECHVTYNLTYNSTTHPGNFMTNIKSVPHLYRSLVCISCKTAGWPNPESAISFNVRQEPYYNVAYQIILPLNITDFSPASDPTTSLGQNQLFSVTMNRFSNIIWYNDGSEIFRVLSVISSTYTGSSRLVGIYNISAVASDNFGAATKTWNWNVTNGTGGGGGGGGSGGGGGGGGIGSGTTSSISGYVLDNFDSVLSDVLVQNGSYQTNTSATGFYSFSNLPNGIYNFSYSKAGYDTEYFIFTAGGVVIQNANVTIYDTTPPESVNGTNTTTGNFFVNNTWANPADVDFNNTLFRNFDGSTIEAVNNSTNYLNLTWSPHYVQNITAQTVDNYGNINETRVWFNAIIPNNPPVQTLEGNKTVGEGELLTFNVSATDLDNDTMTYGTNATNGTLNTTSGVFTWTPDYGSAGEYFWEFNSSDGYGGLANGTINITVNDVQLSIMGSSPIGDPTTAAGTAQTFGITLNRTANITWYNNSNEIFTILRVSSANYTNSVASAGIYNITVVAGDGFDSVSKNWSWNVTDGTVGGVEGGGGSGGTNNSISGYVFDIFGSPLSGVFVQNGSFQNTTDLSGYYSITNVSNGTYNFSYSRAGFINGYFKFSFEGAVIINANRTLSDNVPPGSVSNINITNGNFYINNSWTNPVDADLNNTNFRFSNGTIAYVAISTTTFWNHTGLSPHETQNISARTVDIYGNINTTGVWFNTTIPNNPPVQAQIGNKMVSENQWLNFTYNATDVDNDTMTYGTNATNGSFNTTTGNFSWLTMYSDAGTYVWYFNSSDGYGGVAVENITITVNDLPLSFNSFSPLTDPLTEQGTVQTFSVTLNRTANITWYMNSTPVQTNESIISADYANSSAGIGVYNISAVASDIYDTAIRSWNWTVGAQSVYNVNGYVFDNFGSGLEGVLVQNGSYNATTSASGNYSISGLVNGTYNFSYSRIGFNSGDLEITINGSDNTSANKTIYDTTPPASISSPNMTTGNFYINNTWINPVESDLNYTWFSFSNETTLTNVSKTSSDLNQTYSSHYTQNISAQTVDNYSNINQTKIWFNTTLANNPPIQAQIGNKTISESQWLNFTFNATDVDNDTITYGTNATKGTFNTTTGNFSWLTTYSDSGTYYWYFNSSDGYDGYAVENITITVNDTPLSFTSFSPLTDPATEQGTAQIFGVTLNRTANVTWFINGTPVQTNESIISAEYVNSTAGIGLYNISAVASDIYDSAITSWNWTITSQSVYNVSGYVFDNYGSGLEGVLVQNGSYSATTSASGYYSISGIVNGTYNFSYSKTGFDTSDLEIAINGSDNTSANKTIYDTTPPASISSPIIITGNFYINNTWINPVESDLNYTWFSFSNETTLTNVSKTSSDLNQTYSSHYTQNISAQTVDIYVNTNQTKVWFNATIPDNAPVQTQIGNKTVYETQWLNFTINATDPDNDTVVYGTNSTKGNFDTITGNFSWLTTYSDAGTYYWYFNSSDGYGGIGVENITITVNDMPLSFTSFSPLTDPLTEQGTVQTFSVTLNRTANITWYMNGIPVQTNESIISADYANSSAGVGMYNISAVASDIYDSAIKSWNWTVGAQSVYSVNGYVFDNFGSGLGGVLVQNSSYTATTIASGYYSISGLVNGTYNFSYSKTGFNTDNLEITIDGLDNTSANKTIYDTTPPVSISSPIMITGNFYINNTWINPVESDFNYTWFSFSNETTMTNVSKTSSDLNQTYSSHYTQNISAQTVDIYGNTNQTKVWFNATIPNNAPVQTQIGNKTIYETQWLNFTINATDPDNDTVVYGTNSTKGNFNNITGNFSWLTTYSDAGTYYWYFNSSDAYGGVTVENVTIIVNDMPLSFTSFSPLTDPLTELGKAQTFSITLNRTANVTWYMNGIPVQTNESIISADYANSSSGVGMYNISAVASDIYDSAIRSWNWTVGAQSVYNVNGYVFDNFGSGLGGVLVQNGSYTATTIASGYYSISGLVNGTYNFSYSKTGFNTGDLEITINGSDNTSANKTIYDTTPPASISSPIMITGNFYINNTWINPVESDLNYTWFSFSNDTTLTNVSKTSSELNLTWSPHYTQNISAQTVDIYGNTNQTKVWFNATIPNNPPLQASIGNKQVTAGNWLNFTTNTTDADGDPITYDTNASKGFLSGYNFSWQPTESDVNTYYWYFNYSDNFGGVTIDNITVTVNPIITFIPPAPINLATYQGNFWINHTWESGLVNVTDSFNISVNDLWTNGTSTTYINSTVAPHGWSNITVYAYNSTGPGTLNSTPFSNNTQLINNLLLQASIGNKQVTAGNWLNFTINTTDADNDTILYGTNATNGILIGYNYSWQPTELDINTYYWHFNSSDGYGGLAIENITVTVNPIVIFIPPAPLNLTTYQGNFWINHTWEEGFDNITDSFNISVNDLWTNGTSTTYNNTTVVPHGWSNITVYAYNSTGPGTLNSTPISNSTQLINNLPLQASIGNKQVTSGNWLNFTVNTTDLDGDPIAYGTNASKGSLSGYNYSWQPTELDTSIYYWYFNYSDTFGGVTIENITITVTAIPLYNVSGYVFDNLGAGLAGSLVQNGTNQSTTSASGFYSLTNLSNGTYNFSYSKAGFNTDYLEITVSGADNTSANKTIYDTTPTASINNIAPVPTSLYLNWTWTDPSDTDFDHVEVYIDGAFKNNVSKGIQSYNASYFAPNSSHEISTRTVDTYNNVNTTWMNDTSTTSSLFVYLFGFLSDTGSVSSFSNAQNANDGGAVATFTEVQMAGVNKSNRTMGPIKSLTNGSQNGSYNSSYLDNTDGLIDTTIPLLSGTFVESNYLRNTINTAVAGLYWNLNTTAGVSSTTTTNIRLLGTGTGNMKYIFMPGTQNNQEVNRTPGSVPAGYGWASSRPINGVISAGVWNFQVSTTSTINNRNGQILVYVYKYNATSNTNIFLFNVTGIANHLGNPRTRTENITSVAQPSYTFNSDEYMKVEYWLNAVTGANGAGLTFEANTPTQFVRYSRNNYSLNSTYTFTETNSSSTWQNIRIQDNSFGDPITNVSILNFTSGLWESILTSVFTGGSTPSQNVNVIKGANGNASSYDAGSGQIKIRYNWTGSGFNNSLGVDQINVTVNYLDPGQYRLNITTNTTDIPQSSIHELQLRYNVSGDNFTMQIWNGSLWNNRTILNETSLSYRNITLYPEEMIPDGTLSGNAGNINKYNTFVRYLDINASATQQGRLYLDYQRMYNN